MKIKISVVFAVLIALIVWSGLTLQFYISTEKYMEEGYSLMGALIQIASFFTIQTNLLVAIAVTTFLFKPNSSSGSFFTKYTTLTAITVYISIVGLIYAVILRGLWQPKGLFKLTDNLLHTISPILFVLFWLIFIPKHRIELKKTFSWLLFPLLYLIYSLIRGHFTGNYPYGFIDAARIGYGQTAINSVFVLFAFLVTTAIFVGLGNYQARKNT